MAFARQHLSTISLCVAPNELKQDGQLEAIVAVCLPTSGTFIVHSVALVIASSLIVILSGLFNRNCQVRKNSLNIKFLGRIFLGHPGPRCRDIPDKNFMQVAFFCLF